MDEKRIAYRRCNGSEEIPKSPPERQCVQGGFTWLSYLHRLKHKVHDEQKRNDIEQGLHFSPFTNRDME